MIAEPAVMRQTGRDLAGLAAGLHAGLDGIAGGADCEGTEELPVRVRFDAGARAGLEDLRRLVLEPLAGGVDPVPLTGLASLALVPAASNITRRDGERVNVVRAFRPTRCRRLISQRSSRSSRLPISTCRRASASSSAARRPSCSRRAATSRRLPARC